MNSVAAAAIGPKGLAAPDFLSGGGTLGKLMRAHDWTRSPVGPPGSWPQSLRTSVSTCLNCSFPIALMWGPELALLYNGAYVSILGSKHPAGLGVPVRQVWPELWPVIGPMLEHVMQHGEASPADDLLLMLERYGYPEECYFSFSYSPIRSEGGGVGGVFCPVLETTGKVTSARRLHALSRLGAEGTTARSAEEACCLAASCLAEEAARDLPFLAYYVPDGGLARLCATAGCATGAPVAPEALALGSDAAEAWPLADAAVTGEAVLVPDLGMRFPSLPCGAWDRPPDAALVVPVGGVASAPAAFMVAGLSPHRPVEEVRDFAMLVAGQLATSIGNAVAYEVERRRAEALAEIDRAKTAFFSNVSHEFRTPLTLMLGPLEEVRGGEQFGAEERRQIDIAHRNGLRLLKLVNSLLDFSRVEAGRAEAVYQETDLAGFTADLASNFRSACERAGLRLAIDCAPLPEPVLIDRDMWEKIVLNLVSNAFKFTFAGEIAVSVRGHDGVAELVVRDSGTGIPAAELPRIFERFHRVENARGRTHEGTGIGLALVHELVRLHGGTVTCDSTPGVGTAFSVRVPLGRAHLPPERIGAEPTLASSATHADAFVGEALRWLPDEDSAASGTGPAPPEEHAAGAKRFRVLVADDNADMRAYARRLLLPQYRVETAPDGEAALEALRRDRPDLLVTDVMMPRLDGFGLLSAIRADPALRDLPVILLSARAGEEARIEGLEAGADDYVVKPFSAHELLARVQTSLALAHQRREAEQAAQRSAEALRNLFEEAPGFMCILHGPEHVYELANAAYRRLVGARELIGRTIRHALPELAGQGYFELLDRVYQTGVAHRAQGARVLVRRTPEASTEEVFLDFLYQPITDEAGRVTGIFVEGTEVTDRRRAEEELRQLATTLERRVIEEVAAREQVQARLAQAQRMEALGQLAGGIAHDFNNVLQAVSGGLGLIQKRAERPDSVRHLARMASDAAARGAAITARLLAFSRRGELRTISVEPAELLESLREMLAATLGATINVTIAVEPGTPRLLADKAQLETVLVNLAVNARDAMPAGGVLTLAARPETATDPLSHPAGLAAGAYVRLDVSDTGVGMDAPTLARASEPFFTTKPLGQGTGLGLAMARGFAQQSDGGFAIRSTPGHGTTVTLWFPQGTGAAADAEDGLDANGRPHAVRGHVLVVDDDAMVRAVLARQMEAFGYQVTEAPDGLAALEQLDSGAAPDLLVTDFSMPGMNGLVLIDEARRRQENLPALLLTGFADPMVRDLESARDARTALLRKPIAEAALAEAATAVMRG